MQNEFWFRLGLDGLPTCGSIRSGYSLILLLWAFVQKQKRFNAY